MKKIKILIADDHELVRKGLRAVLELENDFEIVGEAIDGNEVVNKVKKLVPDIVLMDLKMPGISGIEASQKIKTLFPHIKILILTAFQGGEDIIGSLQAGVSGYLLKDVSSVDLISAIHSISRGQLLLRPSVAKTLLDKFSASFSDRTDNSKLSSSLTVREEEVLNLMAKGLKNKDIADTLWISEKTVKTHVSSILHKLRQPDRTQAVLYAIRSGLTDLLL
ncbi:MAG: response regulator transcription factor [Actinobacteria bacterium]|nr:response regulator transcription factor [Actinomycetota bacterium]